MKVLSFFLKIGSILRIDLTGRDKSQGNSRKLSQQSNGRREENRVESRDALKVLKQNLRTIEYGRWGV